MSQEEQGKKASAVVSDAAVKEVIPAKPTDLSDEDLDKVAGGQVNMQSKTSVLKGDEISKKDRDAIKLNCVNEK